MASFKVGIRRKGEPETVAVGTAGRGRGRAPRAPAPVVPEQALPCSIRLPIFGPSRADEGERARPSGRNTGVPAAVARPTAVARQGVKGIE
eukprot:364165-Chlamydomonas_euryale.AAC.7